MKILCVADTVVKSLLEPVDGGPALAGIELILAAVIYRRNTSLLSNIATMCRCCMCLAIMICVTANLLLRPASISTGGLSKSTA